MGGLPLEYILRREVYNPPVGEYALVLGSSGNAMTGDVVAAPAPGSLNTANLSGGAVDGGCPSSDKAQAPWGKEVRRFFCDIHKTKKNRERYRITYTTDGIIYRHVDSFAEIPATVGDMVFVDVIPLQHTDGVIELLRRGVEVYYLRRLTIQKRKRDELKLPKTTRGDIKALMSIDGRWFRRVSEDFLIMRRLISAYRGMLRTHQRLLNIGKATETGFKPTIKSLEDEMDEMASKIADEAGKRYPAYNKLVEELGIRGNTKALESLAELIVYVDFVKSPLRGLKKLLGLYRPVKSGKKKYWRLYDGRLHQAVNRLAMAYYKTKPNGRQCWQLIQQIKQLLTTNQTPG